MNSPASERGDPQQVSDLHGSRVQGERPDERVVRLVVGALVHEDRSFPDEGIECLDLPGRRLPARHAGTKNCPEGCLERPFFDLSWYSPRSSLILGAKRDEVNRRRGRGGNSLWDPLPIPSQDVQESLDRERRAPTHMLIPPGSGSVKPAGCRGSH